MTDDIIRCAGLTKRYRSTVALDGLDLAVGADQVLEVLALCGPPLPAPDAIGAALERVGLAPVAGRKVKAYWRIFRRTAVSG
ncbi:MAG: hypothetical protein ACJ73S_29950 [Mycobacteriales bacterium]